MAELHVLVCIFLLVCLFNSILLLLELTWHFFSFVGPSFEGAVDFVHCQLQLQLQETFTCRCCTLALFNSFCFLPTFFFQYTAYTISRNVSHEIVSIFYRTQNFPTFVLSRFYKSAMYCISVRLIHPSGHITQQRKIHKLGLIPKSRRTIKIRNLSYPVSV